MNNPFNFFDKIYCINLREREDRWATCLDNFKKYDIYNYERIDAIKVNGDIHPKRKGQIGCALSFAKCFEIAKKNNNQKILIFEDDFHFKFDKNETFNKLNTYLAELPAEWDSLHLGATLTDEYGFFPIEKFSPNLFLLRSAHCLHSVAFSKNGIDKIFSAFDNKKEWYKELINNYENMDVFMAKTYQSKNNSFISNELICYQTPSLSNIENVVYDYSQWMDNNFNIFKNKLMNS